MKKKYCLMTLAVIFLNSWLSFGQCSGLTAPWSEDFSASSTPSCWVEGGDTAWKYSTSPGYAASNVADHSASGTTNYAWIDGSNNTNAEASTLETPNVDVSTLTSPALIFYAFSDNTNSSAVNILEVDLNDGSGWVNAYQQNYLLGASWKEIVIDLADYVDVTGNVQARFKIIGNANGGSTFHNDILIDDVSFDEITTCPDLYGIDLNNLTATGVDVSWTQPGAGITQWEIVYGTPGFDPLTAGTSIIDNDGTLGESISGLSANTSYDLYVRNVCNGVNSDFLGPLSFATPCVAVTLPWVEDFSSSSTPSCWSESGDTAWKYSTAADYAASNAGDHTAGGGTNYAWIDGSTNTNGESSTLTTPQIDVSTLTDPALIFYVFSDNTDSAAANILDVELNDGSGWVNAYTLNTLLGPSWEEVAIDLSASNITGTIVQARFTITGSTANGGSTFHNDVLLDDITFDEMPACTNPYNASFSNLTASSVDVTWQQGGNVSTWDIIYGAAGFDPNTSGTIINDTDGVAGETITGLSAATDYDIYIRYVCNGTPGNWVGPLQITTPCVTFIAPWNEDFAGSSTPNCWTESGDTAWKYSTGPAYAAANTPDHTPGGGTNYAWMDGSTNSNGDVSTLTSPKIDVSGLTEPAVQFYLFSNNTNDGAINVIDVEVFDGANWNPLLNINSLLGADWKRYIFSLSNLTITGDVQVRFTVTGFSGTGSAFYNDILIDDVEFLEMPPCIDVDDVEVSNEQLTQVDISWLNFNGAGTQWNIEYGAPGFTQGTGTTVVATNNPYTLTGLTQGTAYEFYIQSDCGGGDLGTWEGPYDFRTFTPGASCDVPLVVNALPYTFTGDTQNYLNVYQGTPGSTCGTTENYLNGDEVVFEFTAATTQNVDIELSDLSAYYAGLFVYEDCNDIGSSCVASLVAGPSDDDMAIEDFQVTAGQTYYIVISSWLVNHIGFTLDIIPFDCNNLTSPTAPPAQEYVAGDTLADLEADTTKPNATLVWYSDPQGNNPIADTTVLVDGTTYYVGQDFNGCISGLTAVTVNEIDCTTLAITATTDDSASCKGKLTLTATASGTGDDIYWFDAATGGQIVGIGSSFTTPEITTTTDYWVAEVKTETGGGSGGINSYCTPPNKNCGVGDDINDFIMNDAGINHLATGCSPNGYGDFTNDPSLHAMMAPGSTYNFSTTHNYSGHYVKIWVDANQNGSFEDPGEMLYASTSGANAHSGSITIPGNALGGVTRMRVTSRWLGAPTDSCDAGGSFGETHDYLVMMGQVICESPRTKVTATINQTGDVQVNYTDLTYVDTNSTSVFGDNFDGDPGSNCPGAGYLGGNDVIYQYTADPANDDIINIELSGITNPETGMYLYSSCGDVGTNCIDGVENQGASVISIEDYLVQAGEQLFIVVSSKSGSTNYTLTIEGLDCANVDLPQGDQAPYFIAGETIADLEVTGSVHNTGFNWYSDAAGTISIPTSTALVSGTTYYVTQTILGCESATFAITPVEFDCNLMGITTSGDTTICAPGGVVDLTATPSGVGSEVYWYDAATAGQLINVGPNYSPDVSNTTTFYATEVYIDGESASSGSGKVAPTGNSGVSPFSGGYGLIFDATQPFNLISVELFSSGNGGPAVIELQDPSGTVLDSRTVTLPVGTTSNPTSYIANLNFAITPGTYRLEAVSGPSMIRDFSGNNFPYDIGPGGSYGSITNGASGTGTSSNYYYFYNWTITTGTVLCESPRQAITVTVNNQPTGVPSGATTQNFCEDARVSDLQATGSDIQWYDSNTSNSPLPLATPLVNGETYYATQTVDACESTSRLAVTVVVLDQAPMPAGNRNQSFRAGDMVSDLVVTGSNLAWYSDAFGLNPIADPTTEALVDQTTYYVSQTPTDECESELLGITVHSELSTTNPVLEGLSYYPNPMVDFIQVSHTSPIESLTVYNLLGEEIASKKVGANEARLDVGNLASGPYFMRVKVGSNWVIVKLIKN
ncbi:GEVED domain-containing protein [Mesonia sp. HuA40]|uniref:Ig-like domain-containing protein n=1 Tax=Mesonia sp. HuA40 TaxID=2602761 RepID=UPI0011CC4AB9|nr:GEVED domain-containing protein [Mesonia sp. HuA40]TXK73875.1 T9SS type A sorting domain-containing protein [Mesonia sp. HuA40]